VRTRQPLREEPNTNRLSNPIDRQFERSDAISAVAGLSLVGTVTATGNVFYWTAETRKKKKENHCFNTCYAGWGNRRFGARVDNAPDRRKNTAFYAKTRASALVGKSRGFRRNRRKITTR
jgi:hypothetical protein